MLITFSFVMWKQYYNLCSNRGHCVIGVRGAGTREADTRPGGFQPCWYWLRRLPCPQLHKKDHDQQRWVPCRECGQRSEGEPVRVRPQEERLSNPNPRLTAAQQQFRHSLDSLPDSVVVDERFWEFVRSSMQDTEWQRREQAEYNASAHGGGA